MAKKVFYDADARQRVLAGAEILYNAVKTTMGPKGRNVIISKSYGSPSVTHDGVTVAKAVELPEADDETLGYKVGAELIKQAANKMNDVAGDGTTTVTVLTYHILNEANKLIAAGHNPMQLRKGLEAAAHDVIVELGGELGSVEDRTAGRLINHILLTENAGPGPQLVLDDRTANAGVEIPIVEEGVGIGPIEAQGLDDALR